MLDVHRISDSFKERSRQFQLGVELTTIGGPCAIESYQQLYKRAKLAAEGMPT
ncbi:hypothetical protein DFAR_2210019 [Desulfarculales bacterium]